MSRKRNWVWALSVLTLFALVAALLASVPASATSSEQCGPVAEGDSCTDGDPAFGYTAPPPTKFDRSGSDQDEYYIPLLNFTHPQNDLGSYKVTGKSLDKGFHKVGGASSVTITTDYNSGSWTFNFSSEVTGEEALNKYAVTIGACKRSVDPGLFRPVTATFTNVDDSTERYVHSVFVRGVRSDGAYGRGTEKRRVDDGASAQMSVGFDGDPGLTPGDVWKVHFWVASKGSAAAESENPHARRVKTISVKIPACGSSGTTTSGKATGDLKPRGCKVQVIANAKKYKVSARAKYRLKLGSKTMRFSVKAGKRKSFVRKAPGKRVVLQAKRGSSWKTLDSVKIRRC